MLRNLHEKASQPDKLKTVIFDNTNGKDSSLEKLDSCGFQYSIHKLNCQNLSGSRAHAYALDNSINHLDTEFTVTVDPDIHVFKDKWDQFCIDKLTEQKAIAIGAPYPRWKVGKYHDFPGPFFCFFRTETLKDLQTSWEPFPKTALGYAGKFIARQLGRLGPVVTRSTYTNYKFIRNGSAFAEKILGIFAPDTGWRIAEKARQKNLHSVLFKDMLPQDVCRKSDSADRAIADLASHYELFFYGEEPVLTHKYGSAKWLWKTKHGKDENFWRECIKDLEESRK